MAGTDTGAEHRGTREVQEEFRDIFAWSIYDLSDTAIEGVEFEVDFNDDKPIWSPKRRYSQYERDLLKASLSPPPPSCPARRTRRERRICGDYRPHNDKTVPDKYPMLIADELFDDLGGSDCFSTLDLRMGYHQIRIRKGDQWKLAFWGHDDLYMPMRTPFGPKMLFQRLMDRVLRGLRATWRGHSSTTSSSTPRDSGPTWTPCAESSCDDWAMVKSNRTIAQVLTFGLCQFADVLACGHY
ncbi:hypothetical protein KFL_005910030 [Klebsormidium nitens]|uniref:Reverse transcriptase domain-containing protein n=1 Tax=Klebsormidium nitens TaxID=105231 RepID=A0A1Y1IMP6_KLENI|nr:hypothetical protein KFL_005910030 [Klebsormidium nitens]|eukprot:GAQ90026.1 hypothetical protein KFL_005910030 [Klebsormidium nitens]